MANAACPSRPRRSSERGRNPGRSHYSATQLKILQEIITLTVFAGFALLYLGERIKWNHLAAFACLIGAVAFTFLPKN